MGKEIISFFLSGVIKLNWIFLIIGMVLAYSSGTIIAVIGKRRKWTETRTFIGITVAFFIVVIVGATIIQIFNL